MTQHQPRQHRDAMRQPADDVPEGASPTSDQPLHGERRPVFLPLVATALLVVLILVVFLVVFLL
jgi:hypothetical protein